VKIALITKRISNNLGGAERVSAILSKKLADAGHTVHVFTMSSDIHAHDLFIRILKVNKWLSPWKLLSFQAKMHKILKREDFDLVYSLSQVFPIDIYRVGDGIHQHWMKIQYPNIIVRWVKYLTSLVHLAMRWLENQIFKPGNCKFFITNSKLIKSQVMSYFHIKEEMIQVIYNGIDTSVFNPEVQSHRQAMRQKYLIENDELVLLFVSNNWERKGLSTILKAIPKTKTDKIRLLVVGKGKKGSFISLAKENSVSPDKIIFTGITDNVPRYYGLADIFVLPTRYEPFSNVCLEAMACGLPVITTKNNGASELILSGESGFVLDDWDDSEGLADMIKNLSDISLRKSIGEKAYSVAKEYTWEKHVEETGKVFALLKQKMH
jgi:UDP-glucose:(heptosyl)LPS alpha-1,3-glucosyltransferase